MRAARFRRAVWPALGAALLFVACGGDNGGDGDTGPSPTTYTVRGRILALPATPGGEAQIEHEAIDGFVDFRGEVVGMDAMTMFFPLAEDAAAEEIALGDIVEFDLLVDWQAEPLSKITRIAKLPADTELVFERAKPPGRSGE